MDDTMSQFYSNFMKCAKSTVSQSEINNASTKASPINIQYIKLIAGAEYVKGTPGKQLTARNLTN
jgi:hypothetical protein